MILAITCIRGRDSCNSQPLWHSSDRNLHAGFGSQITRAEGRSKHPADGEMPQNIYINIRIMFSDTTWPKMVLVSKFLTLTEPRLSLLL